MFQLCVSGCAYVSAYVSACVSDLCFGLGGFVFQAWVSVCGFDVWVTRFGFGGFRCLVGVDFVVVGLFCGVLCVCFVVAVGMLVMLCWCLGGGRAALLLLLFLFLFCL